MKQQKEVSGYYRLHHRGKIIASSYNVIEHNIGPYHLKFDDSKLAYDFECKVDHADAFELFLCNEDILAIFYVSQETLCILYKYKIEVVTITSCLKKLLKTIYLDEPIDVHTYVSVGFLKTYVECKSVYIQPYELLYDVTDGTLVDYPNVQLTTFEPNLDYSWYDELIKHDNCDAVYYDTTKNKLILL